MKDLQAQAQAQEAIRIQNEQRLIAQQQKLLQQQAFIRDPTVCPLSINYLLIVFNYSWIKK